ncbi:MAG: Methylglyoxal synthase (EC [uncultured Caballeronia sp.]|nr:MAG: Methylglyoxal synthase (EC [uncultured Caballeronia sp.]
MRNLPEAVYFNRRLSLRLKWNASAQDSGLAPDDTVDRFHAISSQTLALIAHDAMKPQMASFVDDHFELLSRFACRVSTGTTGRNLNELAWARGWPRQVMDRVLPERSNGRRRANRQSDIRAAL